MSIGDLKEVSQAAYDGAREEVLVEILRLAELRHNALLQIASAADARAVQTVAGCAALASAAFGVAAALYAAGKLSAVAIALAVSGALLTFAAGFAAWAARPQHGYRAPGMQPSQVWDETVLEQPKRHLLIIAIQDAERGIVAAAEGTQSRGTAMTAALWMATSTPGISALVWLSAIFWAV